MQFIQLLPSLHTYTIKMLYFHSSFQYMQKSATYAAKGSSFWGLRPQYPQTRGSVPGPRWSLVPRPHHMHPQYLLLPRQTQGVWIKPVPNTKTTNCYMFRHASTFYYFSNEVYRFRAGVCRHYFPGTTSALVPLSRIQALYTWYGQPRRYLTSGSEAPTRGSVWMKNLPTVTGPTQSWRHS